MIPLLQRQKVAFSLFTVEQEGDQAFNKGILMNAAFREIITTNIKQCSFDCVMFHDIDLIPTGNFAVMIIKTI